jgi:prophage regulatory protein
LTQFLDPAAIEDAGYYRQSLATSRQIAAPTAELTLTMPHHHPRPYAGDRLMRMPEVCTVTGRSKPTIYRWEGEGLFPQRVRIGPNSVGWLESEVMAWLRSRAAARGEAA